MPTASWRFCSSPGCWTGCHEPPHGKLPLMIDLRSDTVTKPSREMRTVIADAVLGDDVFHDDPTVVALEERVAELLGKEDAVYVPTGTMSNQLALRTHSRPGDVVLAGADSHIEIHELGAANAISGLTIQQLESVDGTFTDEQLRLAVPELPKSIPSSLVQPVTLLSLENTHSSAGSTVWPKTQLDQVIDTAREMGIATHMDGARLWNAAVASGVSETEWAAGFDTVSVCFSKGLGAPMGSALAGSRDLIDTARRYKHMHGGGFRQAGMMAAGAIYAIDHNRERLADDHANAARLAVGIAEIPGCTIDTESVHTNIVYFETKRPAAHVCDDLEHSGVLMLPMERGRIRAVTNLDVSMDDIDETLTAVAAAMG